MYTYAWYHWLTFFYIYCFCGWVFESTYVSICEKKFVNRGFLRLPMLPLYGTGAIMMLWLCLPFRSQPLLEYVVGVMGATTLEYATGFGMEMLFKVRYWDYSTKKFNLNGYICLSSSIAWGFLTILMTDVIHRPIEHFVLRLPLTVEACFVAVVSVAFVYDTVQSTREALNLAKALAAITKLRKEMNELQTQLAQLKTEAEKNVASLKEAVVETVSESVAARKEAVEAKLDAAREAHGSKLDVAREVAPAALSAAKASLEARMNAASASLSEKHATLQMHMSRRLPGVLRRNPDAASSRFTEALKDLRSSWAARKSE